MKISLITLYVNISLESCNYNGDDDLDSLAKDQLRQDVKVSKRPVICISITIFCPTYISIKVKIINIIFN